MMLMLFEFWLLLHFLTFRLNEILFTDFYIFYGVNVHFVLIGVFLMQDLCAICTDFIISELWTSNLLAYQVKHAFCYLNCFKAFLFFSN